MVVLAGHVATVAIKDDERRHAPPALTACSRNVYGVRAAASAGEVVMPAITTS